MKDLTPCPMSHREEEVSMIPWQLLDRAQVPGGKGELCLYQRGSEFSIRIDGSELMQWVDPAADEITVLIGGLGMGFTLAAALGLLGSESLVVVAELLPAVVAWNRGPLGGLAGHPLADGRVAVR